MGEPAGFLPADPLGMSCLCGDPAVKGLGELDCDKGQARFHVLDKGFVQFPAGLFPDADGGLDAMRFQGGDTSSRHQGIGVHHTDDDTGKFSRNDAFDTRGRFAVVVAWFKGHVKGGSCQRFFCRFYRVDFGMGFPEAAVVAFSDNPSVLDDDRAHHGIGADLPPSPPRKH